MDFLKIFFYNYYKQNIMKIKPLTYAPKVRGKTKMSPLRLNVVSEIRLVTVVEKLKSVDNCKV